MKIDSLVSLLAGTIEFLYKEAAHISTHITHNVRIALEGTGQPRPDKDEIAVATSPLSTTTSPTRVPHTYARSSSPGCP